ncbi:hypothetical protein LguiA_017100 [Lonicera macranthoides]
MSDVANYEGMEAQYVGVTRKYHKRYGLFGKKFKDGFGHIGGVILGGIVGLKKPENHGVPYSLTEEFTSVYRMHSPLPDHLLLGISTLHPDPTNLYR